MDHERLAYPLAGMATALMRPDEERSGLRPRRGGAFWLGFGLAFGTMAWNVVGYFVAGWPALPSELPSLSFGEGFPGIPMVLYWPMLCIAFFLRTDVSLSLWVFVVLGVIEEGVFNRIGLSIRNSLSVPCFDASRPALAWQSYGAMVVMVLVNLWVIRRHLFAVLRSALRPRSADTDGANDLLSARTAVLGLAVATGYLVLWLWRLGMQPATAILFLTAAFVGFIGLSRLVVEGGLVFILPPLTPQSATVTLLGNSALGPSQLTAMGLSMAWIADPINAFMPAAANAAKVGHTARVSGRSLAAAIGIAALAGIATTIPFTLWLGYRHGAYTLGTWLFTGAPWVPYTYAVRAIGSEPGIEWAKLTWAGMGGGLMFVLTALHYRLTWWPIHPIGLVVGVILKVRWCFLPLLAGWLCKVTVLRLGGAAALKRIQPFFLGGVVGWFAGAALSIIVDGLFFSGDGHVICWH